MPFIETGDKLAVYLWIAVYYVRIRSFKVRL